MRSLHSPCSWRRRALRVPVAAAAGQAQGLLCCNPGPAPRWRPSAGVAAAPTEAGAGSAAAEQQHSSSSYSGRSQAPCWLRLKELCTPLTRTHVFLRPLGEHVHHAQPTHRSCISLVNSCPHLKSLLKRRPDLRAAGIQKSRSSSVCAAGIRAVGMPHQACNCRRCPKARASARRPTPSRTCGSRNPGHSAPKTARPSRQDG